MSNSIPHVQRSLERHIADQAAQFPVLLVTGARQVGKSTLLRTCSTGNRNYVSLDDQAIKTAAQNEPKLFLQAHPPPLTIDEVQYAPALFPEIKLLVDQARLSGDPDQRSLYWLTGSEQFSLMKGAKESLAGRVMITNLFGFSQDEINGAGHQSIPFCPNDAWLAHARAKILPQSHAIDLFNRIWHGSFPEVATYLTGRASPLAAPTPSNFYSSYIQTYIERDIAGSISPRITDTASFRLFLEAVAMRTAGYLNMQKLANDVGIDQRTAKAWLSVLQAANIITLLRPWHGGSGRRTASQPKLHFVDTGLCSYLLKISSAKQLLDGPFAGQLLESYVVAEILKSYLHNGREIKDIYCYKDKSSKEIDLVIDTGETLHPIEIKKTAKPAKQDTRRFDALEGQNRQLGKGAVLCLCDVILPLSEQAWAIPIRFL